MSDDRLFEIVGMGEDSIDLRVTQPTYAREVMWQLLGSKGASHRVFGRRQLTAGETPVPAAARVDAGEVLTLCLRGPRGLVVTSDGPVDVVYRDRVLLAVNKPAGILVHGDGSGSPTLTERVQGLLAREDVHATAQAVQRLDVDTTGLVLFSLAEEFQPQLDAQVAGHEMRKRYLAVVEGRYGSDETWVDLTHPIARDRHDARKMRVGPTGKSAHTRVRMLDCRDGRSLVLVELLSGRRHQIRVHLSHAGHPIVGDTLYGGRRHGEGLMLHAWQERLRHPVTGDLLELATPVPGRFMRLFPSFTP